MYFIPHVRGQNEEAGVINFYRDLINFQYFSQAFYPFFRLWQDNISHHMQIPPALWRQPVESTTASLSS